MVTITLSPGSEHIINSRIELQSLIPLVSELTRDRPYEFGRLNSEVSDVLSNNRLKSLDCETSLVIID